jgi:hypothetical protein
VAHRATATSPGSRGRKVLRVACSANHSSTCPPGLNDCMALARVRVEQEVESWSNARVTPRRSFGEARAGRRPRGVEGEDSRGEKTQERSGRRFRATARRRERTCRRNKTSRRVKPAERVGPTVRDPGQPGSVLRCTEREPIVAGERSLCPSGPRLLKPAVIRPRAVQLCTPVDNREGVSGLERGWRLLRGEDSEGRSSRNGCGTKQSHEAWVCQETAERLGKPESGTEMSLDNSSQRGLAQGTPLKGQGSSGKSVREMLRTARRQ